MKRSKLGSQRLYTNALIISLLIGATMCVVVPVQLFAEDTATDAPQVPPSEGQTTMTPEQPAAPSTSDDAIETRGGMNPLALSPFSSDLSVRHSYSGYREYYPTHFFGKPRNLRAKGCCLGWKSRTWAKTPLMTFGLYSLVSGSQVHHMHSTSIKMISTAVLS